MSLMGKEARNRASFGSISAYKRFIYILHSSDAHLDHLDYR
jgi:hypothetical protein